MWKREKKEKKTETGPKMKWNYSQGFLDIQIRAFKKECLKKRLKSLKILKIFSVDTQAS